MLTLDRAIELERSRDISVQCYNSFKASHIYEFKKNKIKINGVVLSHITLTVLTYIYLLQSFYLFSVITSEKFNLIIAAARVQSV